MVERELTNIDVALFALFRLGGAERPIDTEEIAIECWNLVRERFCWKKYPQYPEIEPARSALFDAAKLKNGKLVRGSKKKTGWSLTIAGIDYVRSRLSLLEAVAAGATIVASRHTELDRYFALLEKEPAYKKYVQAGSCETVEPHEFTQLLKCSLDTSAVFLRDRLEKLKAKAHQGERDDIVRFLTACEEHFGSMLNEVSQQEEDIKQ